MPSSKKSKIALSNGKFSDGQIISLTRENWWTILNKKMSLCAKCAEIVTAAVSCYVYHTTPKTTSTHKISDPDLKILQKKFPKIMFDGEELSFDRDSNNFLFLKKTLKNQVQTA